MMKGKDLLLHPFINRAHMARFMYPDSKDASGLLESKLNGLNNETFTDDDDEKVFVVFRMLLNEMMLMDGQATFDDQAFSDN